MDTANFRDLAVEEFDTRTLLAHAARQAEQRHYEDFFICDVDGHHWEVAAFPQISDYIEDPIIRQQAKYQGYGGGGLTAPTGYYQNMAGRVTRADGSRKEVLGPGEQRDRTLTRRWMDAMGVDAVCLFPTPMLGLPFTPRPDVEVAWSRAYNRWLTETVLVEEPQIKSSLYLPMSDPEAAFRMVQDFGDKKGVIGFTIIASTLRPVTDNLYVKTYAALQERNLPLVFHAGLTWGQNQNFTLCRRFMAAHALSFSFSNILHMTNWLCDAMPERFPRLRTVWVEAGLAWVPFVMQRLDNEYMMRSSEVPGLKHKPSDYMRKMYFSSQPMEGVDNREALEVTFKMMNAETQLMYSSDYPHWDMDLPSTIYDLPFVSEQGKRNILGGNAQRVFNLDGALGQGKMAKRAARATS
ncbi:MAG TPA: amidohydrolase family protein [Stellaceae bacterium]|nr:amidohydrolase family protein [Stellaceae bacterium]